MLSYCLIADQIVKIADGRIDRLLFDFCISEEAVDPARIACAVHVADDTHMHGVRALEFSHAVDRLFLYDLDPFGCLAADRDYRHMTVFNYRENRLVETLLAWIYSALIPTKTLFAHAALIEVPGMGGILFIGDSGVGKTTQAVLWEQHRGAEIINGDKVFLGLRDDAPGQILAYGCPWRGSSPYCVNKRVPLRAVVSLFRNETPSLRRLNEVESLQAFLPRIFMPGWDVALTDKVMETFDGMLPLVPVYQMSCRPDESAVELLENALKAEDKGR